MLPICISKSGSLTSNCTGNLEEKPSGRLGLKEPRGLQGKPDTAIENCSKLQGPDRLSPPQSM